MEGPFNVGSILKLTTCYNDVFQGEVAAFDMDKRMLTLKMHSPMHNRVSFQFINVEYAKSVEVLKENECTVLPPLPALNLQRIQSRLKANMEERQKKAGYVNDNVSKEGQCLFYYIAKTFKDVRWEGNNIVVMDELRIIPPFTVDDMQVSKSNHQLQGHIRKIVEKFFLEWDSGKVSLEYLTSMNSPPGAGSNSS